MMFPDVQLLTTCTAMQEFARAQRAAGRRIAFVPTMGNLHRGHLALVEQAAGLADVVVVSIFVNPLQFDRAADLEAYPRTLEEDLAALAPLGVAAVFAPPETEMYPQGRAAEPVVQVPGLEALTTDLEGASRPGHFPGVVTVVKKLFDLVRPQVAVFGEKDYQQLLVVRHMVRALALPVEIAAGPTVREADGLAMSSRNGYLSPEERARAPELYRALDAAAAAVRADFGAWPAARAAALARLERAGFRPDYFELRRAADLGPAAPGAPLRLLAAAWLGPARLIDNLAV